MSNFELGENAICTPENEARFHERRDSIIDTVQPANIVEQILAEELLHASWEMERVRNLSDNTAAEDRLNTAYSRASRNWCRSLKQLKNLQSARASHFSRLFYPDERALGQACPMADLTKLPKLIDLPQEVQ